MTVHRNIMTHALQCSDALHLKHYAAFELRHQAVHGRLQVPGDVYGKVWRWVMIIRYGSIDFRHCSLATHVHELVYLHPINSYPLTKGPSSPPSAAVERAIG